MRASWQARAFSVLFWFLVPPRPADSPKKNEASFIIYIQFGVVCKKNAPPRSGGPILSVPGRSLARVKGMSRGHALGQACAQDPTMHRDGETPGAPQNRGAQGAQHEKIMYSSRKTTYSNRKFDIIHLNEWLIEYLFLIGPSIYIHYLRLYVKYIILYYISSILTSKYFFDFSRVSIFYILLTCYVVDFSKSTGNVILHRTQQLSRRDLEYQAVW